MFQRADEFPTLIDLEYPLAPSALDFYKNGHVSVYTVRSTPSALQKATSRPIAKIHLQNRRRSWLSAIQFNNRKRKNRMADPRFFRRFGPFCLGDIADAVNADLLDPSTKDVMICDIASLDTAGIGDLSFFNHSRYQTDFRWTQWGVSHERGPTAAGFCPDRPSVLSG
jgi:hypothetical protein